MIYLSVGTTKGSSTRLVLCLTAREPVVLRRSNRSVAVLNEVNILAAICTGHHSNTNHRYHHTLATLCVHPSNYNRPQFYRRLEDCMSERHVIFGSAYGTDGACSSHLHLAFSIVSLPHLPISPSSLIHGSSTSSFRSLESCRLSFV
jgi:hypothetical protein